MPLKGLLTGLIKPLRLKVLPPEEALDPLAGRTIDENFPQWIRYQTRDSIPSSLLMDSEFSGPVFKSMPARLDIDCLALMETLLAASVESPGEVLRVLELCSLEGSWFKCARKLLPARIRLHWSIIAEDAILRAAAKMPKEETEVSFFSEQTQAINHLGGDCKVLVLTDGTQAFGSRPMDISKIIKTQASRVLFLRVPIVEFAESIIGLTKKDNRHVPFTAFSKSWLLGLVKFGGSSMFQYEVESESYKILGYKVKLLTCLSLAELAEERLLAPERMAE